MTRVDEAPPPPAFPPQYLTEEPEAFAFTPRPGREILDLETEVLRGVQEDRVRLVRERNVIACIWRSWLKDPWAEHGCGVSAGQEEQDERDRDSKDAGNRSADIERGQPLRR